VLLVEDLAPLAMAMKDELEHRGFTVIGPAASVAGARDLARGATPAVAVLDVSLGEEKVFPLIPNLKEAGVPIVLLTGHEAASIPEEFGDLPMLPKPVDMDALERLIRERVGHAASSPGS
jgi:ActR/RegA family two-component response regulator